MANLSRSRTPGVSREPGQAIRRIDRYELIEPVGTGGMSVVYRGRDTALDREVAVKLMHPHLAARAESRARFSREARAVARLSHPNIVEIYDYAGDEAQESYLVTEFVRGRTLRAYADEVGFAFPEIGALVARALADALCHAHSAGVIHRDLKPENVMVCEEEGRRAVKLADFGIARILASDERMTMTGALVGSPNHMAPEIIEGREADARSDLFSLGTLLYWLTTGRMPFAASNPTATLRRVIEGDYDDPRRISSLVSDDLAAVAAKAMAGDPAARYASAAEVRDAIDAALAASGLGEPGAELAAFLADPAAYKAALRPRLVAALLVRGEAALREGNPARALGLFNRVLSIEPENAEVLAHLAALSRRTRNRRLVRSAAAAIAVLVAVAAIAAAALRLAYRTAPPQAPSPSPAAVEAAAAPDPAPAPAPAEVALAAPAASPAPAAGRVREPPPATARRPRSGSGAVELAVHVRPYAQRALLDGVEVARGEQRVVFSLPPGRHVIRLEHECCAPYEREIDARDAARVPELKVPLAPRPARLRVEGDPATRIYLGGALLGTAGDSQRSPLLLPVPPSADNPYEGQVELRLEAEGRAPWIAPVKVRAGGEITVAAARTEPAP